METFIHFRHCTFIHGDTDATQSDGLYISPKLIKIDLNITFFFYLKMCFRI